LRIYIISLDFENEELVDRLALSLKKVFGKVDVTLVMIAKGKDLDLKTLMISRNPVMIMRSIKGEK